MWSSISGIYQSIIATEICESSSITGVAFNQSNNRYFVSRTGAVESYSPLGIFEAPLLADCGSDDGNVLNMQSVTTNGEDLLMIGDIQTCTITVFNINSNSIDGVIPLPFRPYKIATYDTNVVYTDVTANKVQCIDYVSQRRMFIIDVQEPTGICFDKSTSCLYVCKKNSSQECYVIGVYCGVTGELKEEQLLSGFDSPKGMCLLRGGKELAVADGKCVKIYSVK